MRPNRSLELSRVLRDAAVAALVTLVGAPGAMATTDDEAVALCTQELTGQGALDVRNTLVRRQEQVPYVYGDADFADANAVHFRCRVFEGKVGSLRYMVKNAEYESGRAWSTERPQGDAHAGLELDEPAMTPPATEDPGPKFEMVPK